MKEKNGRLLSLDVLRGFDMSFIMGGEVVLICLASLFPVLEFIGGQMQHSQWDGFTFYDLIFPLFLFVDFSKPVDTLFGGLLELLPEDYYALGWWCCYILVCWCLLYFLYRKKVFLKV